MPFVYRLDKILNFRIKKRDEQLEVVKLAQREVQRIEGEIDKNNNTIYKTREDMTKCLHIMLETYDTFLQHLYKIAENLEAQRQDALKTLEEEKIKLVELEQAVKVLEKHKERKLEEYKQEESKKEMKLLNEVGSQRHFASTRSSREEELEELRQAGIDIDEY
jgi:flagellar FliJ protein